MKEKGVSNKGRARGPLIEGCKEMAADSLKVTKEWGEKGYDQVCMTIKFLIDELKKSKPFVEGLIEQGIISLDDFDYTKYNGCEVIP